MNRAYEWFNEKKTVNTEHPTVIDKIQKLLALSNSSNENEAKTALLKAQELLAKHKLSMKEVNEYNSSNTKILTVKTKTTFKGAKWKAQLAGVIAENFGCYVLIQTRKTHYIVFIGKDEDPSVCEIVYNFALDCIKSNVKDLQKVYREYQLSTKGLESNYASGFVYGLYQQYYEQLQTNASCALVVVKDKKLDEYIQSIKIGGSFDATTQVDSHYQNVLQKGVRDGKSFSMQDKLSEGVT